MISMNDPHSSSENPASEVKRLRQRIAELEALKVENRRTSSENEEKYRVLYENSPLPYQSLDEDGCLFDMNPAWLRTLGYEREEVMGKCFGELLHPDWKPQFEKSFPEFKKRGYVNDVQFRIRHKSHAKFQQSLLTTG